MHHIVKCANSIEKPVSRPLVGLPKANYFIFSYGFTSVRTKFMVFSVN